MKTVLQVMAFVLISVGAVSTGIALINVQDTLNGLVAGHNQIVEDHNNLASAYDDLSERYALVDASNRELEASYDELTARYDQFVVSLSPPVKQGSATYDCDDATLDAFRFYTERDYPTCIVVGNLELEHESTSQVDHGWLLVRFEGGWLPIDWGRPANDCQHFEGYRITLDQLLREVEGDFAS